MQVRKLDVDDLAQSRSLGTEAFGGWPPGTTPPPLPTELPPGRHEWGAFDDGRLVARVVTLELASWWRGRAVPTTGYAGVAVSPEHRGRGLLRTLFEASVAEARGRGEVISTLFPTANGIYRGLGYELVSSHDTVEVPTAELLRVPAPGTVTTRRATEADLPAVFATYDAWAAAQNGPLTRTGPRFAERGRLLEEVTAVTLAVDADDRVVGFMSWDRGRGYDSTASLSILDLVALDLDAHRALWLVAGSFASVTGTVRIATSGADPARLALPSMTWQVAQRHPYMLRVLDLPAAVAALGPSLPGGGAASLDLSVVGDRLAGVTRVEGGWHLELGAGGATCTPADPRPDGVVLTVQGLGLLVSGAQSCGNLRLLGQLRGPSSGAGEVDAVLDAAFGGRQLHIRDYF